MMLLLAVQLPVAVGHHVAVGLSTGNTPQPIGATPACGCRAGGRYTSRVVLMLAVVGLALFAVIRLSQTLEPRQRVVLVFVFVLGVAWVLLQLVRLGILGRVRALT
jgi:MYXO-CTERM domain-containing protein